ncbi:MAG: sugar phosphate isomerase/epimerase [Thiotrichales bacterium]|nr:sugar phosphate isomerase/epimerase [Thiotrichales bacterium]
MELKLFKTLWGNCLPIEAVIRQTEEAGFNGIEGRAPETPTEQWQWLKLLKRENFDYIAEIVTGGDYVPKPNATPDQHLNDLKIGIERSLPLNPMFATCITGYDAWSESESIDYFKAAMALGKQYDIELSFETHRSRSTFNPWVTKRIVEAIPDIPLTLDISHWCVVCERQMDSEMATLSKIIPNVKHVHARVGYDQGPQVPHPAAPEYQNALQSHQTIWNKVWQQHADNGLDFTTMTPEFGPDGYLQTLPFTQAPVADLWEINSWMGSTQRTLFEKSFKHSSF